MMLAIELAVAKKNNDDLSVQVKEGFEAKRERGQYPGPAPVGYINAIIRPGERNIVPDSINAPKVVTLFEMAATGTYTLYELWKESIAIGLVNPRGNSPGRQTIVEMLQRRTYTGSFKYGGDGWKLGTYEPLISADLFDTVQIAMGWKQKRTNTTNTSGKAYPFKGLFSCGTCCFNITAYTKAKALAGGNTVEYSYYVCTKKNRLVKCDEPQISSSELEESIQQEVANFEISKDQGAECISWLKQLYGSYVGQKNQYRDMA